MPASYNLSNLMIPFVFGLTLVIAAIIPFGSCDAQNEESETPQYQFRAGTLGSMCDGQQPLFGECLGYVQGYLDGRLKQEGEQANAIPRLCADKWAAREVIKTFRENLQNGVTANDDLAKNAIEQAAQKVLLCAKK